MNRLKLMGSEAFRSIGSNLSTSVAATMTVLIGMCLLGLFLALGSWVVSWSDHVKSQLEVTDLLHPGCRAERGERGRPLPREQADLGRDRRVPVRLEGRRAEDHGEDATPT